MTHLNRALALCATTCLVFLAVICPVPGAVTPAIALDTPVRISGTSPAYFNSIQAAYDNTRQWDEIQAQAVIFDEHLVFDKGNGITLHGGYDPEFAVDGGLTVVRGDVRISTGTVIVENIAIAPDVTAPTVVIALPLTGTVPESVYTFHVATPNDMTLLGLNTLPFYNYGLGFDASGTTLYAMDTISRLGTIDTSTGAYTLLGSVSGILGNHNVDGLAADPTTGTIYIVSTNGFTGSSALYSLNPATLSATLIGTQSTAKWLVDLASDLAGNIYTVSLDTDSLYKFDKLSGQVVLVGALGLDIIGQQGMAFDQSSGILYGSIGNRDLANYAFGTINMTTGAFTAAVPTGSVRKMAIPPAPAFPAGSGSGER